MSAPHRSDQRPYVAIVGAGLGGLATALFLHRLNLSITIFESRPRDAADGGFIALAPNAGYVLDQLGLYQELLSKGCPYEEFFFLSARNLSKIGSVYNGSVARFGYPCLRISRHILRQTLLDAVLRAGIEVRFEHKLTNIEESRPSKITATFSTREWPSATTCDYLIACDGIHSRTRQLLFPEAPLPSFSGQVGIGGGQLPRPSIPPTMPLPCIVLGINNSFMFTPTTPQGSPVNFSATIEIHDRTREEWAQFTADKENLKQLMIDRHCGVSNGNEPAAAWPDVVRNACQTANAESLSVWPYYSAPILPSWLSISKRVILTGDAAHAMPPTGGQGSAMAFEDSASLASCFMNLAQGKADISTELTEWQTTRQERIEKIRAFSSRGGDIRKATPGKTQMLMKESLMWGFFHIKGKEAYAWIYDYRVEGPKAYRWVGTSA